MPVDLDSFEAILASEEASLPAVVEKKNGNGGAPAAAATGEEDWQDDPVPVKLDKIRATFLNGKTAGEVSVASATMRIEDWLEIVTKISKQTDAAPVKITAIRIELPPRDAFSADVVEVELPA